MFRCKKCGRTSGTVRLDIACPLCGENYSVPSKLRYCSYCGKQMIETMVGAETCEMFYGDFSTIPLGNPYNKETGKRQYCYKYRCPDYKKRKWYQIGGSPHDDYFEKEIIQL